MNDIEGFYAAYVAGKAGEGVLFLVFRGHSIVGCDLTGFRFDGTYILDSSELAHKVNVVVRAPPNTNTIQGQNTGDKGFEYNLEFDLPNKFENLPFLSLDTPFGPINMRLEKVRDLGGMAS